MSEFVLLDGASSSASPSGDPAEQKASVLTEQLRGLGSAVVAFSGGVDSAYLALMATRVLGSHALVVTADSPSYPQRHRALATRIAREFSFNHEFIVTHELERPEYRANHADRCYHCKNELFTELTALARERGFRVVLDGNNADDRGDYRPGRQAAREFGVLSPLDDVGLTKSEIRELARRVGLPVWNEPASACLSSRIPYESEVTEAKLQIVEQAEAVLNRLGFRVYRVRHHDEVARIELAREEMPRALEPEINAILVRELKALGYRFVALDLQGYRLGSLNESLKLRPV